jgi:hypothetical protein
MPLARRTSDVRNQIVARREPIPIGWSWDGLWIYTVWFEMEEVRHLPFPIEDFAFATLPPTAPQ